MTGQSNPFEPIVDPVMRAVTFLSHRPDTEHVAIILRFCLVIFTWIFVGFDYLFQNKLASGAYDEIFAATGIYCLALALEATHLAFSPGVSSGRRLWAILSDLALLTYFAVRLGETGTVLYPFYLWIMLAAGFRYGNIYLLTAAILSVAALSAHYHVFGLWQSNYLVCWLQIFFVIMLALAMASFLDMIRRNIATAQNASRAKSAFLAGISHEVRTPLQAIKGLSDLLGDTRLDSEQRRMVGTISEAGNTLLVLINSLLDYARAETGNMPAREDDFDLFVLSGRLYRLFSEQARQKSLDLNFHFDPSLRRLYHGNLRFLEDILTNLIANAIKFTHHGQVTLRVRLLEENSRTHRICFEVIDTGIGIASEAQQRIFDRFIQSDDEVLAQFGGSGLGLALCRQYSELMGGEIEVFSSQGQGSTFTFTAPFGLMLKNGAARQKDDEGDFRHRRSVMVISPEPGLLELDSHAAPVCDHYDNLHLALKKLSACQQDLMPSLIVIDRQGQEHDIALIKKQVAACGKGGFPLILWVCRENEQAEKLALIHPQHGLSFVDRHELQHRFCKLLRLAEHLHEQRGEKERTVSQISSHQAAQRLQILVADDNRTNQMVIEKMLLSLGHQVTLAENGRQAIAAIRYKAFDLAFLDIRMPVLDGLEASRRLMALAREGELQTLPTLYALTADPTLEMEQRCRQAGMKACLLKPIERERLKELLDVIVEQKQQIAENRKKMNISDNWGLEEMYSTQVIEDLRDLGGDQFVVDLAHQFSEDGILALKRLNRAVNECDDEDFRNGAHALRSAAANIGARSVFDLCLSWRDMTAAELDVEGSGHMLRLAANLNEAIGDLEHILSVTLPKPELSDAAAGRTKRIVNH
ncbi:ATP-binding protein [uncultured Cohaesibacter sp.]|uniref:ATP-binding protein n=1 Tax=uncultured Cohaesibacter sp. TaxID=1002546 RepID=UPI0029C922A2|nr:ATP-binding protein [uncultured Cohaesibacter sp.]